MNSRDCRSWKALIQNDEGEDFLLRLQIQCRHVIVGSIEMVPADWGAYSNDSESR